MHKIPLYIPDALKDIELAAWFKPLPEGLLFKKELPPNFFTQDVERVSDVSRARAIVLPNNFKRVDSRVDEYVRQYAEMGEKHSVPVYCFSLGDFTDKTRFDPRVCVFRLSVYRSRMRSQDIVIPALTEDNAKEGILVRKKPPVPRVSFCGMGGFPSWQAWIKYWVKIILYTSVSLVDSAARARIVGIYWRRAAMRACRASPLVETHFIVRKTFSGHRKSIELDPVQARREYLESIIGSDFVLAPKGDGNYSNRFFKTLCMGRIPVVTDTDIVLPLEDVIAYEKMMVRVPMDRVRETPRYIREFYDILDDGEYERRQRLARETFENYLRVDSFFRFFFTK